MNYLDICDNNFSLLAVNFGAMDFKLRIAEIMSENPTKTNLEQYAQYGAFHEWKGKATNFHEVATTILQNPEMHPADQAIAYGNLVSKVLQAWFSWCAAETVPADVSLAVANQYSNREFSKINHWVNKSKKGE